MKYAKFNIISQELTRIKYLPVAEIKGRIVRNNYITVKETVQTE